MVLKVSGMVHVMEDSEKAALEWKAIDSLKNIAIPLSSITKLRATPEGNPKTILLILYKNNVSDTEEKKLQLTFMNRPTMNKIKETLQTVVARQRTVIKDSPTPTPEGLTPDSLSQEQRSSSADSRVGTPQLSIASEDDLSDQNLLKNHQLQQKLLMEDKGLRKVFTHAVMNYGMMPNIFWLTRLNQLRTYALTISQQRGPYNVLSTIKPVASSDNKVNVSVTRDAINEIFRTYPIIKRAFDDLVPLRFTEGEFWSRFFNSKLFRRLRGDRIQNSNEKGDVILDKYLYMDQDSLQAPQEEMEERKRRKGNDESETYVSRFLDVYGNEVDNSQKLGNMPDVTMRFSDDPSRSIAPSNKSKTNLRSQEDELIILMKNMNNLSSKMVNMVSEKNDNRSVGNNLSSEEKSEYTNELSLHDLNEAEGTNYIELHLNPDTGNKVAEADNLVQDIDPTEYQRYFEQTYFKLGDEIDLTDIYKSKDKDIIETANGINGIVKQNFKVYRSTNYQMPYEKNASLLFPDSILEEISALNITIIEFLSQFWKLFLSGSNSSQLKKIFTSLKNSKSNLNKLLEKIYNIVQNHEANKNNPKAVERIKKDLYLCFSPLVMGLDKACTNYVEALRQTNDIKKNGETT